MDSETNIPDWQAFEIAVARFAAAMDPAAVVRHNVLLPDTGHQRQRDLIISRYAGQEFHLMTESSA